MAAEAEQHNFAEFIAAVPFGKALLDALDVDELRVTEAFRVEGTTEAWLLAVHVPSWISRRFSVRRLTIAVVVSEGALRSVTSRHPGWSGPRDLLLVASSEPGRVRVPGFWGQIAKLWFFQHDDGRWQLDSGDPDAPVFAAVDAAMRSFDLFDRRDPLIADRGGVREATLRALEETLLAGQSVGLFGLRKVGKTSLGRTIADAIDPQWAAPPPARTRPFGRSISPLPRVVVWLDVQGLTERSRDGLAGRLSDMLRARIGDAPVSRRSHRWEGPEEEPFSAMQELDGLLEHCEQSRQFVCFILDEQDLLFVGTPAVEATAIVEVFALLRSHAQRSGLCSVLFIGRDPQWLQAPTMNGVTSPTPGWLRTVWLEPMTREESDEIVRHLAARTGLLPSDATCALIFDWTGGHPFLLRQFGSAFWHVIAPGTRGGAHVEMESFHDEALAVFLERDAVIETCREVEHLLASRGSAVSSLFWRLARRPHEAVTLPNDSAATPLRKYGLLRGTRAEPQIARVWTWWSAFVLPTLAKTG